MSEDRSPRSPPPPPPRRSPAHGHTGPATAAEAAAREADPATVPPADKAAIAVEASRQEDA